MPILRKIKKVLKSKPTLEGAGVHLKRAFGNQHVPQLDPFLLLDDFHSSNPDDYLAGFPWHPHRGIETITYVLHGKVEHGDSMGNKGIISSGDVQWMTAGSGIIHQEMPKGQADGLMWGFQLWANLPASHKMMEPRYRDVKSHQIPEVKVGNGAVIKIISGTVEGVRGPVQDIITPNTWTSSCRRMRASGIVCAAATLPSPMLSKARATSSRTATSSRSLPAPTACDFSLSRGNRSGSRSPGGVPS
jgi:hypothetical protein